MRGLLCATALLLSACDDALFLPPEGTTPTGEEGWCAVQSLFASTCETCHGASVSLGGLDLMTDPYNAVVGVVSATYGEVLVAPEDPDGSLLQRKLEGTHDPETEGGLMPPGGGVDAARIEVVRQWIADGATDVCNSTITPPPGKYHPEGWAEPGEHGLATKMGEQDCRTCHGPLLDGGSVNVSCQTCHPPDWITTCTFCHGDPTTGVAAPPEDIDDNADPLTITFPEHQLHLSSPLHPDWGCPQCHMEPTSALDPAHVFDDATPGLADLAFTGGLAPQSTYSTGTCANSYCHGNGRGPNGTVSVSEDVACGDCHSVLTAWGSMSGVHDKHLDEGIQCAECHPDVSTAEQIVDKTIHVDGEIDVALPAAITYNGVSCSGSCHGEDHQNESWIDN